MILLYCLAGKKYFPSEPPFVWPLALNARDQSNNYVESLNESRSGAVLIVGPDLTTTGDATVTSRRAPTRVFMLIADTGYR